MAEYGSSGDPSRTMALLWRTRAPSSRGPRASLSLDGIVEMALTIANEEGMHALSIRRLAERLEVGAMSLYNYVPGKSELLDLMVDAVCGETLPTAKDKDEEWEAADWRARLELIARRNWALYERHPWLLQVSMSRPVLGPNVIAKYDRELAAVDGIGLDELEMDSVVSLVNGHTENVARLAREKAQVRRRTGLTDHQWWQTYAPLLESKFDEKRFPVAARVGPIAGEVRGPCDPQSEFEFGLKCILDGIETLVRERRSSRESKIASAG